MGTGQGKVEKVFLNPAYSINCLPLVVASSSLLWSMLDVVPVLRNV